MAWAAEEEPDGQDLGDLLVLSLLAANAGCQAILRSFRQLPVGDAALLSRAHGEFGHMGEAALAVHQDADGLFARTEQ
ncbi:MAG: hypothetical protein ABSB61_02135 [Anaerolineales bacterium]